MTLPVNFDSVGVDAILADWVRALRDSSVEAVLVLGPNPMGGRDEREVLAVAAALRRRQSCSSTAGKRSR